MLSVVAIILLIACAPVSQQVIAPGSYAGAGIGIAMVLRVDKGPNHFDVWFANQDGSGVSDKSYDLLSVPSKRMFQVVSHGKNCGSASIARAGSALRFQYGKHSVLLTRVPETAVPQLVHSVELTEQSYRVEASPSKEYRAEIDHAAMLPSCSLK